MKDDQFNTYEDSLIHMLLAEKLGNRPLPDLADAVMERARQDQSGRVRMRVLAIAAGFAILCVIGAITWWGQVRYPTAKLTGMEFDETQDVYAAIADGSTITLGGYCHIEPSKGSKIKLAQSENDEKIYLVQGDVLCRVDKSKAKEDASFEVRTSVGAVRVTGTEFTVGLVEQRKGDQKMKKMIVRVLAGSVLVTGAWGSDTLDAEGKSQGAYPPLIETSSPKGNDEQGASTNDPNGSTLPVAKGRQPVPKQLAKRKKAKASKVYAQVTTDEALKSLALKPRDQLHNFRYAGSKDGLEYFVVDFGVHSFPGVSQKYEKYYCVKGSKLPKKTFPITEDVKKWESLKELVPKPLETEDLKDILLHGNP